jgi:hypothetical protein
MRTFSKLSVPALTCAIAGFVTITSWGFPATAQQVAASQAVNLPAGHNLDSWEHIYWDTSKGPDANPADCKAVGGAMRGPPGSRRCFIAIKTWLALAPGNVIGEICNPGQGRAIPVLLTADDAQYVKSRNRLVWTSADGKPFGYEQASKCDGK